MRVHSGSRRFALACAALGFSLSCAALSSPALAQSAAEADKLFQQGRAAMARGQYDAACALFEESDHKDSAVGTKLNLAACEEKRGRLVAALRLFLIAETQLQPGDDRLPVAKRRIAALTAKVPLVTVRLEASAPSGTTVRAGTTEIPPEFLGRPFPIEPGRQQLLVNAPGRPQAAFDVEIEPGHTVEIDVAPGASAKGDKEGATPAGSSSRKTRGYIFAGVGAAGATVGIVAGIMALGKKGTADDNCDDSLRVCNQTGKDANDSGRKLATVSTVGWLVGAVGLGTGAYFLLSSDKKNETGVATHLGVDGARVSLVRRW